MNERFESLAQRYLGRSLVASDGSSSSTIERAEKRLGYELPRSMRKYHVACGRNRRFNRSYNVIRALDEIAIEDGYCMVMDENQGVVSWGIPLAHIADADPIIWQRNNTPPVAWYPEEKTWSELLESMFAWYLEAGIWKPIQRSAMRDRVEKRGA